MAPQNAMQCAVCHAIMLTVNGAAASKELLASSSRRFVSAKKNLLRRASPLLFSSFCLKIR